MFKVFAFGFGARTRTINDLISDALPGSKQRDVASCHLLRASTHVQQQRRAMHGFRWFQTLSPSN